MRLRPKPSDLCVVAAGGALGALLRWWAGEVAPRQADFPWTTFTINVVGCVLLAALPVVATGRRTQLFVGTGLLGGFTTMSATSVEARDLLAAGETATALAYLLGTLVVAIAAVNLVAAWRARAVSR